MSDKKSLYDFYKMTDKEKYEFLSDVVSKATDMQKEVLSKSKNKSIWDLKYGEIYYWITYSGDIAKNKYISCKDDSNISKSGNSFLTKEEAEKELEKRKALMRIKKYIWENNLEFEPDWDDSNEYKYYIEYNINGEFEVDCYCSLHFLPVLPYFKDEEDAMKVIESCEEDLKILFYIND